MQVRYQAALRPDFYILKLSVANGYDTVIHCGNQIIMKGFAGKACPAGKSAGLILEPYLIASTSRALLPVHYVIAE